MAANSLISILILLAIALLIPYSHADPRLDIVARSCEESHVQNVGNYSKDYEAILTQMRYDMFLEKFAYGESGEPPDKLFVLSQCMDDLSSQECAECFAKVSNLLSGCFPATGGRVYLDGCFMRASNYSFFSEIIAPGDMNRCSDDMEDDQGFDTLLRDVLQKAVRQTRLNSGFGTASVSKNGTKIHSMAQCWNTLDQQMCSECLKNAFNSVLHCVPSDEGRALKAGCFLRYSTYEFLNDPDDEDLDRYAVVVGLFYLFSVVAIGTVAVAVGLCLGKMTYGAMSNSDSECKREVDQSREKELDMAAVVRAMQFKFSTLEKATDGFSEAHKLGSGGAGVVYKGTLPDGREIAIKRLYINGRDEINYNLDVVSKVQHKNVVHFLGGCFTTSENILVFEYFANKSLDIILFDPEKKKELDWEKRRKIIMGTAEGLEYLHKGCGVPIVHRDIKASNILLDLKYRPKIADFGLARYCSREATVRTSPDGNNVVAGTFGYMAPEYIAKGRLSEKVDVYSFGVLMLEIVSGVKNTTLESDNSFETLVTRTWKHFQSNTTSKIIDESLVIEDVEDLKRVIQIGLLCTQAKPTLRPNMTRLLQKLRHKEMEIPIPTKPPFLDVELFGCNPPRSQKYSVQIDQLA